jgi:hypothetical protein
MLSHDYSLFLELLSEYPKLERYWKTLEDEPSNPKRYLHRHEVDYGNLNNRELHLLSFFAAIETGSVVDKEEFDFFSALNTFNYSDRVMLSRWISSQSTYGNM